MGTVTAGNPVGGESWGELLPSGVVRSPRSRGGLLQVGKASASRSSASSRPPTSARSSPARRFASSQTSSGSPSTSSAGSSLGRIDVPALHQLLERRHRGGRTEACQIGLELGAEGIAPQRSLGFEPFDPHRVHDGGPQRLEVREGRREERSDVGIRAFGVAELADDADPEVGERSRVEVPEIVVLALEPLRGVVGRVRPGQNVEDPHAVFDGARHRAADVPEEVERHDPVPARQAHRGPDAEEGVVGRRPADGVAGVRPEAHGPEAGGHRGSGASGGSRRYPIGIVGVPDVTGDDRAEALIGAEGELGHVGLGEHDGARFADPLHLEGVIGRDRVRERRRSGARGKVRGVVVVLHDHRDALERPVRAEPGIREALVGFGGPIHRPRIDRDDRVEGRALPVVGLDPGQVGRDQLRAGEVPSLEAPVDPGDIEFRHVETGFRLRRRSAATGRTAGREQRQCDLVSLFESARCTNHDPILCVRLQWDPGASLGGDGWGLPRRDRKSSGSRMRFAGFLR